MYCLKCGQETEEDQAFCLSCRKEMVKYPVSSNAVVQLPPRKQTQTRKPVKKRISPEDQIHILKKRVRLFACLFLASLLLAVCLSIPVIRHFGESRAQIGQNYTTLRPASEPTEATATAE